LALGRAGRRWVEREHDWGTVMSQLFQLYQDLAA
jgi:hypothetical protein